MNQIQKEMTAKEAKQKAFEYNTQNSDSQLAKINAMISDAVSRGEYEIIFGEEIKPDIRNHLVEQGYYVGITHNAINNVHVWIKWL